MGHVWSKTRSLAQILEKACMRSRGNISSSIVMELGQNVCLDEISREILRCRGHIFNGIIMKLGQNVCRDKNLGRVENGSCLVKI